MFSFNRKKADSTFTKLVHTNRTVEIEIYSAPKEWTMEGLKPITWEYTAIISDNIFMSGNKAYDTPYDAIAAGLESARSYQFQDEMYVNPTVTTYSTDKEHYAAVVKRDDNRRRKYNRAA